MQRTRGWGCWSEGLGVLPPEEPSNPASPGRTDGKLPTKVRPKDHSELGGDGRALAGAGRQRSRNRRAKSQGRPGEPGWQGGPQGLSRERPQVRVTVAILNTFTAADRVMEISRQPEGRTAEGPRFDEEERG